MKRTKWRCVKILSPLCKYKIKRTNGCRTKSLRKGLKKEVWSWRKRDDETTRERKCHESKYKTEYLCYKFVSNKYVFFFSANIASSISISLQTQKRETRISSAGNISRKCRFCTRRANRAPISRDSKNRVSVEFLVARWKTGSEPGLVRSRSHSMTSRFVWCAKHLPRHASSTAVENR